MNLKRAYPSYFVIAPLVIYLLIFIIPLFIGFLLSFTDWNQYNNGSWGSLNFEGLNNFKVIFDQSYFSLAFKNTILFTAFTTVFKNIIGLLLAVLLNMNLRTRNLLRTVYFMPVILSSIVVGVMFTAVFKPDVGILNSFFSSVGLGVLNLDWLGNPSTAMIAVEMVDIWKNVGFCMVVYLTALQTIPKEYYEASRIDGAGAIDNFKNITLPLIVPALNVNILLSIVGGLRVFDLIIVITGGGPGNSTEVLSSMVYRQMANGLLGIGTAVNMVLIFIITAVALVLNNLFRKIEVEA